VPGFRHTDNPHPAGTHREWVGRSLARSEVGQLLRQKPQAAADCPFAATPETLSTWAAAVWVIPWTSTGSNASSSSYGRSPIAWSTQWPSKLSPEPLLAGAGTSPSRSSAASPLII
jgi:hypothetical protein